MDELYPKHQITTEHTGSDLARIVCLDNPDSYPFDEFHSHQYNEMLVFTKGGGKHNINFKEHIIRDKSIHLLAAGDVHWVERGMQSEGFAIVYKDAFLMKLKEMNPSLKYFDFFSNSNVLNLKEEYGSFSVIIEELRANKGNNPYILNLTAAFLTKIAQTFYKVHTTFLRNADHKTVVALIGLINNHYREHFCIDRYAELLNCSANVLEKKVKRITGKTILSLQQEKLLNEAKRQLCKEGNCSKVTAYELGFSSEAYFSNWFKKLTGCSPLKFREGLVPVLYFLLSTFTDALPDCLCC